MNYFKLLIPILICVLFSYQHGSAQVAKYKNYEQHYYQGVRYGWFKPAHYETTEKYPLIVYLHGSTDTVSRDNRYYQEAIQKENPVFVLTPKCEEANLGWGDTWHNGHTPAMRKTLQLIDSLMRIYPIDPDRLYLYGISMGAFGVFSTIAKEPGKFAAAYAICGGADVKVAAKLLPTPLWIFHGAMDDVVPVSLSRDVYQEMIRLGGKKVKYTEYPGVKHDSWIKAEQEKELTPWLFAQKKQHTR